MPNRKRTSKAKPADTTAISHAPLTQPEARKGYPRREPSGWLVAPGTPLIPDEWWPFFDGTANEAADWDHPLWAINSVQFLRVRLQSLPGDWERPRTRSNAAFWSASEGAIRLAMNRVIHVAPLNLTTEECDRIQDAYATVKVGLEAYRATSDDIRLAGGDPAPDGANLIDQWAQVDSKGDNPRLAKTLLAAHEANPFRSVTIVQLTADGGVFNRLSAKLLQSYKAAQGNKTKGKVQDGEGESTKKNRGRPREYSAQHKTDCQKHYQEWRTFFEAWKRDGEKGPARPAFAKSKKMTQIKSDAMIRYGAPARKKSRRKSR